MTVDRDKLTEPFPKAAIKQREATKGGKLLDYVEGHTVIHRLNDSCDSWDLEIKDIDTSVIGKDNEGNDILLVRAHVALTLPELGTREHIGVQAVRARAGEDLVKGAVTDALKKAATLFGVGLELYGPDYEAGEIPEVATNKANAQGYRGPGGGWQQSGNNSPNRSGGGNWMPSPAQIRFAISIRDQLNLYEAYPDGAITSMDGPTMRRFIDEYKERLPPKNR